MSVCPKSWNNKDSAAIAMERWPLQSKSKASNGDRASRQGRGDEADFGRLETGSIGSLARGGVDCGWDGRERSSVGAGTSGVGAAVGEGGSGACQRLLVLLLPCPTHTLEQTKQQEGMLTR